MSGRLCEEPKRDENRIQGKLPNDQRLLGTIVPYLSDLPTRSSPICLVQSIVKGISISLLLDPAYFHPWEIV